MGKNCGGREENENEVSLGEEKSEERAGGGEGEEEGREGGRKRGRGEREGGRKNTRRTQTMFQTQTIPIHPPEIALTLVKPQSPKAAMMEEMS